MTHISSRNSSHTSNSFDLGHSQTQFSDSQQQQSSTPSLTLSDTELHALLSLRGRPEFSQNLNQSIRRLLESSNAGAVALLRLKESFTTLLSGQGIRNFFHESQICAALAYGALKVGVHQWAQRGSQISHLGFLGALEAWMYDDGQNTQALEQAQQLARLAPAEDLRQFRGLMDAAHISDAASQMSGVATNYQGLTSSLLNQAGSLSSMMIGRSLSARGWSSQNFALALLGGMAMGTVQGFGNGIRDFGNLRREEWAQAFPRLFWNAGRQIVESSLCAGVSYGVGLGLTRTGFGENFATGLLNFFLADGIGETSVAAGLDRLEIVLGIRQPEALDGSFAGDVAANLVEEVGGDAQGHAIHHGIQSMHGAAVLGSMLLGSVAQIHTQTNTAATPLQNYSLQSLVDLILQAEISKSHPELSRRVYLEHYIDEILAGGEAVNLKAAIRKSGIANPQIRIAEAIFQSPDPHRAIIELISNALDAYKQEGKIPEGVTPRVEVQIEEGRMLIADSGKGMDAHTLMVKLLAPMLSGQGEGSFGTFGVGFYTASRYLNSESDEVVVTSSTGTEAHQLKFFKRNGEVRYTIEKLETVKDSGTVVELRSSEIKKDYLTAHVSEWMEDVEAGEIVVNGEKINTPLSRGVWGDLYKLDNPKRAGKIRVLVGGILIETFDSNNPNSPGFALALPLGKKVSLTRNQIEVSSEIYDALERVIKETKDIQLLNVLATLCKAYDKRFMDEQRKQKAGQDSATAIAQARIALLSQLKQRVFALLKEEQNLKRKVYPEDPELRKQILEEDAVFLHPLIYEDFYLRRFAKPRQFVSGLTKDQSGEQRELKLILADTKDVFHYDSERAVLYLDEKFYKNAQPYVLGALFAIPDLRFSVNWSLHQMDAALSVIITALKNDTKIEDEIKNGANEFFEKTDALGFSFQRSFFDSEFFLQELEEVDFYDKNTAFESGSNESLLEELFTNRELDHVGSAQKVEIYNNARTMGSYDFPKYKKFVDILAQMNRRTRGVIAPFSLAIKAIKGHIYFSVQSSDKCIPIQLLDRVVSHSKFFNRALELKNKGHFADDYLTFILYASDELWAAILAEEYLADNFLPYLHRRSIRLFFERALRKKTVFNPQYFDNASRLIQIYKRLFTSYSELSDRSEREEDFFRKIEMILRSDIDIDHLLEDLYHNRKSQDAKAINILMETPHARLLELQETQIQAPAIATQSLAKVLTHSALYSSENDATLFPVSDAANTPAAKLIERSLYHAIEPLYVGNPHAYVRELLQNSLDVLKLVRERNPEDQNTKIEFKAYATKDKEGKPQLTVSARDPGGMNRATFMGLLYPGASTKKRIIEMLNDPAANQEDTLGGFGIGFYSLMRGANWVRVKTALTGLENKMYIANFEVLRNAEGKIRDIQIAYEETDNEEGFVGTLVETQRRCSMPELEIARLEAMVEEMGMYVDCDYAEVSFQGRRVNSKKVRRLAKIEKHPKLGKLEVYDGLQPKLVLGQLALCDLPDEVWMAVPKPLREYFKRLGFFIRLDPSVLKPTKNRETLINHEEVMEELKKLLPGLLMRAFLERVADPAYKEDLHYLPQVYFVESYAMAGSITDTKIREAALAIAEHRYEDAKLAELVEGKSEEETQRIFLEIFTLIPCVPNPQNPNEHYAIEQIAEFYRLSFEGDDAAKEKIEALKASPFMPSSLKERLQYAEGIRHQTRIEEETAAVRLSEVNLEQGKRYSIAQIENENLKSFAKLLERISIQLYQAQVPDSRIELIVDALYFEGKAYAYNTQNKNIFTIGFPYTSNFHSKMQRWAHLKKSARTAENLREAETLLIKITHDISHEVTHQALEHPQTTANTHTVQFHDDQAKKSLAKGGILLPSVEELLDWE